MVMRVIETERLQTWAVENTNNLWLWSEKTF